MGTKTNIKDEYFRKAREMYDAIQEKERMDKLPKNIIRPAEEVTDTMNNVIDETLHTPSVDLTKTVGETPSQIGRRIMDKAQTEGASIKEGTKTLGKNVIPKDEVTRVSKDVIENINTIDNPVVNKQMALLDALKAKGQITEETYNIKKLQIMEDLKLLGDKIEAAGGFKKNIERAGTLGEVIAKIKARGGEVKNMANQIKKAAPTASEVASKGKKIASVVGPMAKMGALAALAASVTGIGSDVMAGEYAKAAADAADVGSDILLSPTNPIGIAKMAMRPTNLGEGSEYNIDEHLTPEQKREYKKSNEMYDLMNPDINREKLEALEKVKRVPASDEPIEDDEAKLRRLIRQKMQERQLIDVEKDYNNQKNMNGIRG